MKLKRVRKTRRVKPPNFPSPKVGMILKKKISQKQKGLLSGLPFKKLILASFLINCLVILSIIFLQKQLPPEIPLYHGLAEGTGQLAPSLSLSLPAVISLLVVILNTLLSIFLKNRFLKKILITAMPVVTFFSTIAILKIFFLVGSF